LLYRLVNHSALADDQFLSVPLGLPAEHWFVYILAPLIGTIVMLAASYMGEAGIMNAWTCFAVGMAGSSSCLEALLKKDADPLRTVVF